MSSIRTTDPDSLTSRIDFELLPAIQQEAEELGIACRRSSEPHSRTSSGRH